ncbi:MAG: hypothetical protein AABM67_15230 [Acidobacteriota bacterium]
MTENNRANINTLPEATLRHFQELRGRLLHLHKTLLDMERADFERDFGRLNSGELLQLVINHAQFAWLRMISALVVQIDEMLSAEEPATPNDARNVIAQARSLVISPADEVFREKYQAALQREPKVVMAHSEVAKLLRKDQAWLRQFTLE